MAKSDLKTGEQITDQVEGDLRIEKPTSSSSDKGRRTKDSKDRKKDNQTSTHKTYKEELAESVQSSNAYLDRLNGITNDAKGFRVHAATNTGVASEQEDFKAAVLAIWPDIVVKLKGLWDAAKTLNEEIWVDYTELNEDLKPVSAPHDHLQVAYEWVTTRGVAVFVVRGGHRWRLKVELDLLHCQILISSNCELGPQLGQNTYFSLPEQKDRLLEHLEERCEQLWKTVLSVH